MGRTRDGLEFMLVAVDNAGNVIPLAGDANGQLLLGNAGGVIGQVRIQDGGGGSLAAVSAFENSDAVGTLNQALLAYALLGIFNGTTFDRVRSASAANLAAQSGLGAALVAAPGNWAGFAVPAAGSQATYTRAAGAAGVRHIGTAVDYGYGATTALAAGAQFAVNLIDGTTGLTAWLMRVSLPLPAATIIAVNNDSLEGRSYPGSAATAMTAEWNAAAANLFESVALSGYDTS